MGTRDVSLVVGGSGFVGVELVRRLVHAGRSVRVFDRAPLGDPALETQVDYVQGDVRDERAVTGAVRGASQVYHLAAMVPLTRAGQEFRAVNVGGTEHVIRAAADTSAAHVVHLSSSAIYGVPAEIPITENTPLDPLGAYGRSKADGEMVVRNAIDAGLSATVIRPRTVIGLGRLGIFQILFDMIANQRPIAILGSGDHEFQLISNRDLARVMIAASDTRATGVYNVGTGKFGTMRADLNETARLVGSSSRVRGVPAWCARPTLKLLDRLRLSPFVDWHYDTVDKPYWFDCAKVAEALGWIAEDSNVEMLVTSYRWYLSHRPSNEIGLSTHRSGVSRGLIRLLSGSSAAGRGSEV